MNSITKFGLGLAALGRPGYINIGHAEDLEEDYSVPVMELRAHDVLDAAWESGVRYFDCARSYGRAEEFVGSWIVAREIGPEDISIGSKWGYTYTADWQVQTPEGIAHEVKQHELQILENQHLESSNKLGPHLKLYQIHSATPESGVLENKDVLAGLWSLKQDGMQIGISVSGLSQADSIERAITIEFDGVRLFDSVQATWNLLENSAGNSLQSAHESGLKVIVKEGLANGRLTSRNDNHEFAKQFTLLNKVAAERKTSVDALALAAVANQPWVTIVLSGASTVEHLHSNLRAANVEWDEELARELESLIETPDEYWRRRSELAWN